MRSMRRVSLSAIVLALVTFVGACAPSIGTALDMVNTVSAVRETKRSWAMRREAAPLAGTYAITIEVEGLAPVTIYGKTLFNKNIPMVDVETNDVTLDFLGTGLHRARANPAGYMTNLLAYRTLEEVPDSLSREGMIGGGFLIALAPPADTTAETSVIPGYIALRLDSEMTGTLGDVARAYEKLVAAKDVTKTIEDFMTRSDGSVSGAVHFLGANGDTLAVLRYRRISTAAFGLSEEALKDFTMDDMMKGYLGKPDKR